MSRSANRLDCDAPYTDGRDSVTALDFLSAAGSAPFTKNAPGDFSLNIASSATVSLVTSISTMIYRLGVQDALQEAFGSGGTPAPVGSQAGEALFGAQGNTIGWPKTTTTGAISPSAANVAIPVTASAGFTVGQVVRVDSGASQEYQTIVAIPNATTLTVAQLQYSHGSFTGITQGPFTTPAQNVGSIPPVKGYPFQAPVPRPKGIAFTAFGFRYQVTGAALTSINVSFLRSIFTNNGPLTTSSLVTLGANGLPTAVSATGPYDLVVPVVSPNNGFQVNDAADFWLEVDIVTAAGTCKFYGVDAYVSYNYN